MVSIRRKILYKGNIVQEQLLNVLQKHEDALGSGSETDATITEKVTALETAVGGENSGLVKAVADVTGETASLVVDVGNVKSAIGDESTEGTILARIKALENAQAPQQQEGN